MFLLDLPLIMVTYVDTDQQIDELFMIAATQDCEGIVQHNIKNNTHYYNTPSE